MLVYIPQIVHKELEVLGSAAAEIIANPNHRATEFQADCSTQAYVPIALGFFFGKVQTETEIDFDRHTVA